MTDINDRVKRLKDIESYIVDPNLYGRMRVDLNDIIEASEWLLSTMSNQSKLPLTADVAEDFLIELDINYVQHVTFHLNTLRMDIASVLEHISNLDESSALSGRKPKV